MSVQSIGNPNILQMQAAYSRSPDAQLNQIIQAKPNSMEALVAATTLNNRQQEIAAARAPQAPQGNVVQGLMAASQQGQVPPQMPAQMDPMAMGIAAAPEHEPMAGGGIVALAQGGGINIPTDPTNPDKYADITAQNIANLYDNWKNLSIFSGMAHGGEVEGFAEGGSTAEAIRNAFYSKMFPGPPSYENVYGDFMPSSASDYVPTRPVIPEGAAPKAPSYTENYGVDKSPSYKKLYGESAPSAASEYVPKRQVIPAAAVESGASKFGRIAGTIGSKVAGPLAWLQGASDVAEIVANPKNREQFTQDWRENMPPWLGGQGEAQAQPEADKGLPAVSADSKDKYDLLQQYIGSKEGSTGANWPTQIQHASYTPGQDQTPKAQPIVIATDDEQGQPIPETRAKEKAAPALSSEQQIAMIEKQLQVDTPEAMAIKGEMEKRHASGELKNTAMAIMQGLGSMLQGQGTQTQAIGAGLMSGAAAYMHGASDLEKQQAMLDALRMKSEAEKNAIHREAVQTVLGQQAKTAADIRDFEQAKFLENLKGQWSERTGAARAGSKMPAGQMTDYQHAQAQNLMNDDIQKAIANLPKMDPATPAYKAAVKDITDRYYGAYKQYGVVYPGAAPTGGTTVSAPAGSRSFIYSNGTIK